MMCLLVHPPSLICVFFFNDTATTEIYTLSLHDALPILDRISAPVTGGMTPRPVAATEGCQQVHQPPYLRLHVQDRKSTRLNSSHSQISYAVFCLKKKN